MTVLGTILIIVGIIGIAFIVLASVGTDPAIRRHKDEGP